jgi:hypothetical protein
MLFSKLPAPANRFDWKTNGFLRFIKNAVCKIDESEDGEDMLLDIERIRDARIIPDAFCVDEENRMVYVLEIVNTHDIDDTKAGKISDCFWLLDYAEYQLVVLVFYEDTQRLLLALNLMFLDRIAEQLEGRQYPYRDAFRTLCDVYPSQMPKVAA